MTRLSDATSSLRGRYVEGFPAKWRVVEEALARLRAGDEDAEETLRRIAHQVRGSAASFGFWAVDKSASQTEHAESRELLASAALGLARALRSAYECEATATTRVLLIDDDPAVGVAIMALLSDDNLDVTQVTRAAAAIEELERETWQLILVDLVLPDADGRSLLTHLRGLPHLRYTPIAVLSAKTSPLVKNECAVYGVDDFIEKPIHPETFAGRVAGLLERARSPQPLSSEDRLTGLPNRLGFGRAIDRLTAHQRVVVTLAVVAVEHFEEYGTSAGREAGERALCTVARLLRECIRSEDLLARWGGAQFLVAFPGLHAIDVIEHLERATGALRERTIVGETGTPLSLTAGVTELEAEEILDYGLLRAAQLLQHARRSNHDHWYAHSLHSPDSGRPKILMAEDDPVVAALLLRDLSEDFDLTHAPDGDKALEAAEREDFDLVLLDYQMPGRDGVEVVRSLREMPSYRDKPILLLTSVGSDAAVEAAFEAGADDYINKPHRRRALLARLTRHLGRVPRTVAEAEPQPQPELDEPVETEITAMFCDISGFTGIAETLSPRELLELLNDYFPVVSQVVSRHGGRLEKYIGDAVLAIWGAPESRQDDALRAVEAAVEIQEAVGKLSEETGRALQVHIGLNSGPAIAANIGAGDSGQFAAVGSTTNVASRVCELAGPGEIIVSGATARAVAGQGEWTLAESDEVTLRGCAEPVPIHRLSFSSPA